MRKGKFNIVLALYAVTAMILAIFGQILALIVLTGFVIAAENDEWTSKQCLQAFAALAINNVFSLAVELIEKPFDWLSLVVSADTYVKFVYHFDRFFNFTASAFDVIITVFLIIGVINVVKEKDAKIPFASNFADWAYGHVTKKAAQAPIQTAAFTQTQAPVQTAAFTQTQTPIQPQSAVQPAAPAQMQAPSAQKCPNCGKEVDGAFCGNCGTKIN